MLNLNHKLSEMCIQGHQGGPPPLQYVDENPRISHNNLQPFVPMQVWQKKGATNGSDQGSRALVHDGLHILLVSIIWTPLRFRPASAKDCDEVKGSKLSG